MIINWREEFLKLLPETTLRELEDNCIWCDKCSGIGFTREGSSLCVCNKCKGKGYIKLCSSGCGNLPEGYSPLCAECKDKVFRDLAAKKNKDNYNKATKIKFADYEGVFLSGGDSITDKDDFEDWLYELVVEGDYPEYVYGTTREKIININLEDMVYAACEDTYEGMVQGIDCVGLDDIQTLFDEWVESQGEANYMYTEDFSVVVLLDDLIIELKKQAKENSDL